MLGLSVIPSGRGAYSASGGVSHEHFNLEGGIIEVGGHVTVNGLMVPISVGWRVPLSETYSVSDSIPRS